MATDDLAAKPELRTAAMANAGGTASRFRFDTGSLCLDFVATAGPGMDVIADQTELEEWLAAAELPSPSGGVTTQDVSEARRLRAAIDRLLRSAAGSGTIAAEDIRTINLFAREPTPVYLLTALAHDRSPLPQADLAPTLSVIARDAIFLVTSPAAARIRECARPACRTLFYDRSPSGRRRWCVMKGCGQMVAAASYRRRKAKDA